MGWTKKEIEIVFLLTAVLFFVALAAVEIGLEILRPAPDQRDELLGWRLKANFQRQFTQRTLGGRRYLASFVTNSDGLRVFGTNDRAPIRIFVLGDSFTADPYASNNQMWYAKMAERLVEKTHRSPRDFYVLAGGAGGWGTYQELLLAQQLARGVHPDLLVLEFCSNDFQNNSYEWESHGVARGQYMRRPFAGLDGNGPHYAPGVMAAAYRSFIGQSRILSRIDGLISSLQFKHYGGYIRPLPVDVESKYERDSIALTETLLVRLRRTFSTIPAIMVNCDGVEAGPNRYWKSIGREAGFISISGPSDFLRSLNPDQRKDFLNADGSHMAEGGNRIYGDIAGDEIAALHLPAIERQPATH